MQLHRDARKIDAAGKIFAREPRSFAGEFSRFNREFVPLDLDYDAFDVLEGADRVAGSDDRVRVAGALHGRGLLAASESRVSQRLVQ